jgi:hypothetical protein
MKKWMRRLAEQHRTMRRTYPTDELAVVFDIDDTILDMRHMVLHVLRAFDRHHDRMHFAHLDLNDIDVTETKIHEMIETLGLPREAKSRAMDWFRSHSWSPAVVRYGHRAFPGAMDVIRWLQSQPGTIVGLNTGRPESIRRETLDCLKRVGRPHGVGFSDDLLFMNPHGWGEQIVEAKVEGVRFFREKGYRITAFVDNEPENLQAVARADESGEILLLHADTLYKGERSDVPQRAISGKVFDVTELAGDGSDHDEFGKAA